MLRITLGYLTLVCTTVTFTSRADAQPAEGCTYSGGLWTGMPMGTMHSLNYSYREAEPGHEIRFGEDTYVLVRMPFIDQKTGDRYAVIYPERVGDYRNPTNPKEPVKVVHPNVATHENVFDDTGCSDVAVIGVSKGAGEVAASVSTTVHVGLVDGKSALVTNSSVTTMLNFRTLSTAVSLHLYRSRNVRVGCENLKQELAAGNMAGDWECPPSVSEYDYDLVEHVDWSVLEAATDDLRDELDELIDYVSVEKLQK